MSEAREDRRATELLARIGDGERSAADELYPLVYAELHALAQRCMGGERRDHTLQPTALVHEAFLKLVGNDGGARHQDEFLRLAARAMRNVLVDHARRKRSAKRGGGRERAELHDDVLASETLPEDLLAFDEALEKLEQVDPQLARVVELRFFAGHTIEETARILGVSHGTVEGGWRVARLWLAKHLGEGDGSEGERRGPR